MERYVGRLGIGCFLLRIGDYRLRNIDCVDMRAMASGVNGEVSSPQPKSMTASSGLMFKASKMARCSFLTSWNFEWLESQAPTLRNRPRDRPFFLWLAALDPHREYEDGALNPPHEAEEVLVPPHLPDTPEVREDLRLYYDEIGRLDQYVGQVVTELDRRGGDEDPALVAAIAP
ncbi:MAG: hypothetical protein M2R45_04379 [Verrucomicrobia subdivision 3 bacterium]|nr:hypothetical protein [Limisphaerales bacterium]MCS1416084.1 hypothetical protein [Limisphaerales bacterium]